MVPGSGTMQAMMRWPLPSFAPRTPPRRPSMARTSDSLKRTALPEEEKHDVPRAVGVDRAHEVVVLLKVDGDGPLTGVEKN